MMFMSHRAMVWSWRGQEIKVRVTGGLIIPSTLELLFSKKLEI